MIVTSSSRAAWRHLLVLAAAGMFALAGVGPVLGGAPRPTTASAAADARPGAPPSAPSAIRGREGLTPGGPGRLLPVVPADAAPAPSAPVPSLAAGALALGALHGGVTVGSAAAVPPTVGSLVTGALAAQALASAPGFAATPDAGRLPASCPGGAWRAAPVPGGATGPAVVVSLSPTAPDTCQGFAGPLPLVVTLPAGAGDRDTPARITARTTEPVAVAVLATPGISVRAERDEVGVLPIAPTSGPVPEGYEVEIRDRRADWRTVCTSPDPTPCAVPRDDRRAGRGYRVTARLGGWHRSSPPVVLRLPPSD